MPPTHKRYVIAELSDINALCKDKEQFERFLPEFIQYLKFIREAHERMDKISA